MDNQAQARTVTVYPRSGLTKSDLRTNREKGRIPGIVYGKKVASAPIYIDEKELHTILREGGAAGRVLQLQLPEQGEQPVMLGEIQRDNVLGRILHVDFHQIELDKKVKATVRVELSGEAQGVQEGGMLQVIETTVEVRCLASAIPSAIHADISRLKIGDHLFVRDLQPPAGVEIRSDENEIIATVLAPQKELPEASDEIRDNDVAVDTAEKLEANRS